MVDDRHSAGTVVIRSGVSGLVAATVALGGLAVRYALRKARVDSEAVTHVEGQLKDLGEVESLRILPLVERLVTGPGLRGEPGVSLLLITDDTTLLFDCGLARGRGEAPLGTNAAALGVSAKDCDAVVISHLHPDHVGGIAAQVRHTFAVPESLLLPRSIPAFVPTAMRHPSAEMVLVSRPQVVAPGVAVLPPLSRMLFWLGPVAEQALVVNVRGFGLVLVTGCGHPRIESTLAAIEQALDVPVRGVVGGLHLPVHPAGTALLPQAILGNPNWPWVPIGETDAREAMAAIGAVGPRLIALSGHDSTPWTYDAFQAAFGDRYRTLRVGEPVEISAASSFSGRSSPAALPG